MGFLASDPDNSDFQQFSPITDMAQSLHSPRTGPTVSPPPSTSHSSPRDVVDILSQEPHIPTEEASPSAATQRDTENKYKVYKNTPKYSLRPD